VVSRPTRRELLAGAAAADEDALHKALAVEQIVVFAYEYVLAHVVLAPPTANVVSLFVDHERAHVRALTMALRKRGGSPPSAPADLKAADEALSARSFGQRLADVHTDHDAIDFLFGLEGLAEGAYFVALAKLQDPALVQAAAQMMANEGQHAAILGLLKHPHDPARAVPGAFVEGQH
jgi:rubrerythrin